MNRSSPSWGASVRRVAPALALAGLLLPATVVASSGGLEFVTGTIGPPRERPLAGAELDRRTDEVAALVRCPVCQGSSVADSPSTMARNMKSEVRELLSRGYSSEQVLQYFEQAYGEFVRMQPKVEGLNTLLWLMPALVLVGGALGIALALRRGSPRAAGVPRERAPQAKAEASESPKKASDDPELAEYLSKVRNMAYGEESPGRGRS